MIGSGRFGTSISIEPSRIRSRENSLSTSVSTFAKCATPVRPRRPSRRTSSRSSPAETLTLSRPRRATPTAATEKRSPPLIEIETDRPRRERDSLIETVFVARTNLCASAAIARKVDRERLSASRDHEESRSARINCRDSARAAARRVLLSSFHMKTSYVARPRRTLTLEPLRVLQGKRDVFSPPYVWESPNCISLKPRRTYLQSPPPRKEYGSQS